MNGAFRCGIDSVGVSSRQSGVAGGHSIRTLGCGREIGHSGLFDPGKQTAGILGLTGIGGRQRMSLDPKTQLGRSGQMAAAGGGSLSLGGAAGGM